MIDHRIAALAGLVTLLHSGPALAQTVTTLQDTGAPALRVDVVVLGDGYTSAELGKFANDVDQFLIGFFAEEPFLEYRNYFNVRRIDVASNQSGADHPELGSFRDTAFDATYNCAGIQRLICVTNAKVQAAASVLAPAQRDLVIVIVNDPEYGGSGGAVAIASTHALAAELVLHESGHTVGLLADEYTAQPPGCSDTVEPTQVNAAKIIDRTLIKWAAWVDPSTPLPTSTTEDAVPGAYQGSRYCPLTLYRPTFNSKMRTLNNPFEQINTEQLIKRIYAFATPIESRVPSAASLSLMRGQMQSFSITVPQPATHSLDVTWRLDGQPAATGLAFSFDTTSLSIGTHTLVARSADATAMVRSDPQSLLFEETAWTLQILPGIAINDVAVIEGHGGTRDASFTVTLSEASAQSVTVSAVTANGTALAPGDFTAAGPTTLTFAPGVTSRTFVVQVKGDNLLEPNETFSVGLSNSTNATISDNTGLGTIIDDDPSRVFVAVSGSDANACSLQTTPCRNMATALSQVGTDGEVIVLSPGEYDSLPILIERGVKITSPSGTVAFIRQPITVNAPGHRVAFRGLTLKGVGGSSGITLQAAESVSLEETTIESWNRGLDIATGGSTRVSVTNSSFLLNQAGIRDGGPAGVQVSLNGVRFERNGTGVEVGLGTFVLDQNHFTANTTGVSVTAGQADIGRSEFWTNTTGISTMAGATARVGRSHIFGNTTGILAAPGSAVFSFGSNVVRGNGINVSGSVTTIPAQ